VLQGMNFGIIPLISHFICSRIIALEQLNTPKMMSKGPFCPVRA